MKPVQPEIIRGTDFVAVKTVYQFSMQLLGPGWFHWTGGIPIGQDHFLLMDHVSVQSMILKAISETTLGTRHQREILARST